MFGSIMTLAGAGSYIGIVRQGNVSRALASTVSLPGNVNDDINELIGQLVTLPRDQGLSKLKVLRDKNINLLQKTYPSKDFSKYRTNFDNLELLLIDLKGK
jgi:hypothetical protein